MLDETNNKINKEGLTMGHILNDEEIKAIYKKMKPEEQSKDTEEKVSFLSLQVKKALKLVGY